MKKQLSSIGKHSSIYAISVILKKGIGFLLIPLYTRYLSPYDYGVLELFSVTINITVILVSQGLVPAFFRSYCYDYADDEEKKREALSTVYYYLVAMAAMIFLLLSFSNKGVNDLLFKEGDNYQFLLILIFISGFFSVSAYIPMQLLRALSKSAQFAAITIASFVLNVVLKIYLIAFAGFGLKGAVYANLVESGASAFILFLVIRKHLAPVFSRKILGEMLRFGLPFVPSGLAIWILSVSDRYFLQHYSTTSELGLYSLAYKFSIILDVAIIQPFVKQWPVVYFPLSKEKNAKEIFSRFGTIFLAVITFAGLSVFVFSKPAIYLMAKKDFWGSFQAILPLVCAFIFSGLYFVVNIGVDIQKKTIYYPIVVGLAAIINIVLNFILIPRWAMIGAAYATAISYFFMLFLAYVINQKVYPIQYEKFNIFKISLLFAIFAFAANFSMPDSITSSILIGLIFVAGYAVAILFSGVFSFNELGKVKEIVKTKMSVTSFKNFMKSDK
ncbi:MAG: hypothetical protein D6734_08940 [Candidatus Schekmanbacteria bacterium]|nr:MAG: hypothetical protein D6734_08940 [Candidatus Schekmanbacteria bacterium]